MGMVGCSRQKFMNDIWLNGAGTHCCVRLDVVIVSHMTLLNWLVTS
jgi:hypothetical protein